MACKQKNKYMLIVFLVGVLSSYEVQCIEEEDGQCIQCPRGYIINKRFNSCFRQNSSEPAIICPDGYFLNSGLCTQCHPSCETCLGTMKPEGCTSCARGYYPTFQGGSGQCSPCAVSFGDITGVPGCIHCALDGNTLYCLENRRLGSKMRQTWQILFVVLTVLVAFLLMGVTIVVTGGPKSKYRSRRLPMRYVASHKMV